MTARPQHGPTRWTAIIGAAVLAAVALAPGGPAVAAAAPVATGPLDPGLFDAQLTRAPYLTDLVDRHVAVNFATPRALGTANVTYGPVGSDGSCDPSTGVVPERHGITVNNVDENQWTAQIDVPSTGQYCYRVYAGGIDLLGTNPSPTFTTQVQAGGTESFSFDVMGDWGQVDANGDNPDMANLMQQIAASRARFMVTVGDNGYPAGSQNNYGDLQQKGKDLSAIFGPKFWTVPSSAMPIFTIPGNHGLGTGIAHTDLTTWTQDRVVSTSGGRYQNDVYCCVNGTQSENYASEWYAFTAGNARFYMLDAAWGNSNLGTGTMYSDDYAAHWAPGSPEREWLAADLAAHPTQLKFAFFHYPLYVDNPTESSDTYLQGPDSLEGLLAKYGVQMAFNGHAHLYERNNPSAPGMPVSYVTGGGGGTLEPISGCSPFDAYGIGWSPTSASGSACGGAPRPASAAEVFHFLKVTVSGNTVTVAPTNSLGNTFDVHTYAFGPPPPPPSPPDTTIDSGPDPSTNQSTATFTFEASEPSATFSCTLDGEAAQPCTSPFTYSNLADGDHTFTVTAKVDGLTDPTPASQGWTVDTTAPSVPTGLTADPSTTQIGLSWSPSSGGAVAYHVYRDGDLLGTTDTTGYTDKQVTQGTSYRYQVTALDGLGNESAQSDPVTTGLEPPPETTVDSGPDALTKDTSATFTFHASDPSATFSCTLDGAAPEPCTSPTTYSGLGDGVHTFTVAAAIDGTPDPTPDTRKWTVDTTAPSVPTGLSASASTTQIGLSWSPSSGGAVSYHVYRDGVLLGTSDTTGYTDTTASQGTSYRYQVSALDGLGNESARSDPQAAQLQAPPAGPRRIHLGGVSVRLPAGSRQVVTVNHTRRYHARVTLWQESRGHWRRVARAHDGRTGSGGLVAARRLRQGSKATPVGTFGLVSAFGRHHRHHAWELPYRRVRAGDYWVGDNRSAFYNRYRNKAAGGFRWWLPPSRVNASQRLSGHRRQFEMAVVTDFNQNQVRHHGAGIFLQVNARRGTTGSVSAPRWFLARTLAVLDPAERPVIAVGR